ncbi:class I SAM-dependent methyltransferase [Uliginosibacterium sp. H1]|uniref:class I SAM-dependent methyltransferase n=1 Tax=Uliginosibacterium sp. H1 TaxID=3114757 RepID=UPI002E1804FF|nr:class I SAM-dependent methyltransferase [Uliginosibacterium sp. H1]
MPASTDGYVTELPYSINHFPEMAPAHLRYALLQAGIAAPALDAPFNYLELGFGQGLGLTMLAALHPRSRFFGNDFMPAHVAAAQAMADSARLTNLQIMADSFAELAIRDLPAMDYIVLHGVYSWVDDANRDHILAPIQRLLKPGGVVYVSYNALPGWANKAPLQHLMSEIAQRQEGSALQRFDAARRTLGMLDHQDAAYFAANPGARSALREIAESGDAYLLHEFAPAGWSPFYHTDIASRMAGAGLQFAASARLFSNVPQWSLPASSRALITGTADSSLRELMRDYVVQTPLRRDVFVHGIIPLEDEEIIEAECETLIALLRPPAACARNVRTPIDAVRLDDEVADALLEALAKGPHRFAALRGLGTLAHVDPARVAATLNLMLCIGYLGAVASVDAAARVRAHALNAALLGRLRAGQRLSGLVSPAMGTAVAIAYHDLLFLAGQQEGCQGEEALSAYVAGILARVGDEVVDAQAAPDLRREAYNFLKYGDAYYRSLDLFATP